MLMRNFEHFSDAWKLADRIDDEAITRKVAGHIHLCQIYLIANEADGLVKIGRTRNFTTRFNQLRYEAEKQFGKERLFPIATWWDCQSKEQSLHIRYHQHRVFGEWFRLGFREIGEILSYYVPPKAKLRIKFGEYL